MSPGVAFGIGLVVGAFGAIAISGAFLIEVVGMSWVDLFRRK